MTYTGTKCSRYVGVYPYGVRGVYGRVWSPYDRMTV